MGLFGSFLSNVFDGISSICSGISERVGAIAASIVPTLPEIEIAAAVIGLIAEVVVYICEKLGLLDQEETPEELGMKAEKSDKKPEDFDSTEEYINYLRENIEISREELDSLSPEDRVKYKAVGTAIAIQGIEEKYDIKADGEFWKTVAERKLSGEQVDECIQSFKERGMSNMNDMSNYLQGKELESGVEKSEVSGAIKDAYKKLEPDLSDDDLEEKLYRMQFPETE